LLAVLGALAVFAPPLLPGPPFPDAAGLRAHVAEANRVYGHAGLFAILDFRWQETRQLILPLLIAVAQKTFGLMLAGIAVWRRGVIRDSARFRRPLWIVAAIGATLGIVRGEHVPLAIAYGCALLSWPGSSRPAPWVLPFVAAGRMALTNYLAQSLVFAAVFYGTGWFGRLAPAPVAAFGLLFYAVELGFSRWWLARHSFGPFEWAWRSLTYGRRM